MTAPQGERAGFRSVTTEEPESPSKAEPPVVEWAAEHVDPHRTTLRVNGACPLTLPTGTGDGSRELRLMLGICSVETGTLDRTTGGFNSKGLPRRGVAKLYFTRKVEVTTFDASGRVIKRMMPLIQVVQPALGDAVHMIPSVKGSRSHYRTKARVRQQAQTAALIEQLQMQGEATRAQNAQMAELMRQNQELMARMLDARVLAEPTRAEPARAEPAEPAEPHARAEPPFDPGTLIVPELSAKLEALNADELELVMLAELRGDLRGTAIDAIKRAISATRDSQAVDAGTKLGPPEAEEDTETEAEETTETESQDDAAGQ